MLGAHLAYVTRDMRGYAFAVPALGIAFLLLWVIEADRRCGALHPGRAARLWTGYAAALLLALWTHLLSAPIVMLVGVIWILLAVRARGPGMRQFIVGGMLAHGVALIGILPWGSVALHNVHYWTSVPIVFMTPTTLSNLLLVFILWFPFGQLQSSGIAFDFWRWLVPVGALTLIVPTIALAWSRARSQKTASNREEVVAGMALSGCLLSLVFVGILWTVDRLDMFDIFLGQRYTVMALIPWTVGLVAIASLAARHSRRPVLLAWMLMIPWLASNLTGRFIDIGLERVPVLRDAIQAVPSNAPPAASTVYIQPSDLLPYYRQSLRDYDLRPVEDLATLDPNADAVVLNLNSWSNLARECDAVIWSACANGLLSDSVATSRFPNDSFDLGHYEVFRMVGFHPEVFARLLSEGCRARDPELLPNALSEVHPRQLRMLDGWNALEIDQKLFAIRWTSQDAAAVRLPLALAPGRYVLALAGMRHPYPAADTPLSVSVDGEAGEATVHSPAGWMDLRIPLTLTRAHARPVVRLHYPAFAIKEFDPQSSDPRTIGLMIHRLWIELADAADETK